MTTHIPPPSTTGDSGRASGALPFRHTARGRRGNPQAWMVTFTDLVALMLTFFVMLYAMSTVEQQRWQSLVNSLADQLNAVGQQPLAVPEVHRDMPAETPTPGTDLDYLSGLLRGQLLTVPPLDRAVLRREPDRLLVSLPANLLFPPDGADLDARAAQAVFALGGVLRNLPNRIEVVGHADPRPPGPDFASNWELSLLRARAIGAALVRAGYVGAVVARGYGSGRYGSLPADWAPEKRRALARRVDVVIHESAREALP